MFYLLIILNIFKIKFNILKLDNIKFLVFSKEIGFFYLFLNILRLKVRRAFVV